jgi:uncharacterized protein YijF (DUF1287 family)
MKNDYDKSTTDSLIKALRVFAVEIQTLVTNDLIKEAADRLEMLDEKNAQMRDILDKLDRR